LWMHIYDIWGCLYGEILIAITEFLNFGGCICTHQLLSSFAPGLWCVRNSRSPDVSLILYFDLMNILDHGYFVVTNCRLAS
jgi:hypothetical protein